MADEPRKLFLDFTVTVVGEETPELIVRQRIDWPEDRDLVETLFLEAERAWLEYKTAHAKEWKLV